MVGVLGVTAVLWADSTQGREVIARQLESLVSEQIAGTMRIGGIDRVSVDHVVARDIRFSAPRGEVVLVLRRVDLDLRMLDLLRGHVATTSARVRGGTIYAHTDARGSLGLDLAFRSPRGSSSTITVDFDHIRVSGVQIRARVSDVPDIRVARLSCVVRVWTPAAGARVQLRASRIAGHVDVASPIPIAMALRRGTLRFDGASIDRARLDVHGTSSGSPVRLDTRVAVREHHLRIVSQLTVAGAGGWIRSSPMIAQATLADLRSSSFDLRVRTRR